MGLIDKYPYTDFHELNLDWVINEIKALAARMTNFEVVNTIQYRGEWDINKQYPAWSVVIDNDLGYIAIKNVPAGISIDNADYWEAVANFSAQIADLANRVSDLESDNATNKGNISNLQTSVNTINTKLFPLVQWKDRKVLWVGDSYGQGWDGTQHTTSPYTTASELLGCQYVNISHGGTRFGSPSAADEYHYITHIQSYVSSHTASDLASFTDVIIIGGANDITFNPSEDLSTAIANTVTYVKNNFPNAIVRIGMIARMAQTGSSNATITNINNVMIQYKKGAMNNGAIYISKCEMINHDYTLLASDGIHLTSYAKMGQKLAQLLMSGDFDHNDVVAFNKTLITSNTTDDRAPTTMTTANTTQLNSEILIDVTDLQFIFSTPVAMIWKKAYKFCKVSGDTSTRNLFAAWSKAQRLNVTGIVTYNDDGDDYTEVQPFTIYLYDNYLYISWDGIIAHGGANMNNCKEIDIRTGFQFRLNEYYC